jgi:deoxycytidine triphosphate deaminase
MTDGVGPVYADSDDAADARFSRYGDTDPFPGIEPALLNSADIADYVAATGMIYPFYPEALKSASYPVRLAGPAVYWDHEGTRVDGDVVDGGTFTLKQNSIAFVTLEPMFRVPDYLAMRFNLKIPNVYRGLLLGTGPLVDPGWTGRLSIPLHNLTTNDYVFDSGEELIWIEFTKLSANSRWAGESASTVERAGQYSAFPPEKRGGDVASRIAAASPNRPVISSLGATIQEARRAADAAEAASKSAETAKETSRTLSRNFQILGGIAAVVGLGTIVALAAQVWELKQSPSPPRPTPAAVSKLQREQQATSDQLDRVRRIVAQLEAKQRGRP